MSFELNHDNLQNFLKKIGFEPIFQEATNQVYILMKIKEVDLPLFFGISLESSLLQIVGYLPYQLHAPAFGETARMLHLLNKQLDMPGFGMDENEKLMFYRSVIPCPEDKVDENLLGMYIGTLRFACDTFMYAIGSIAAGKIKVDDFLKENG
ncbi:MAG: YbjN domain-containing protein [Chlamydiales bacterium]|nr:YbjN domain-containing protein [Chlamydiales bacterium]